MWLLQREAIGNVRSNFIVVKRVMDNEGDFEEVGIVKSLQITHKKLNESIKREIERLVSDKK